MNDQFLAQAFVYLAAALITVPIASRLGLGSVLGYLFAGVVIGPFALGLVGREGEDVMHFAELGVVMMLFLIGLELRPSLLWELRKTIVGLGDDPLFGRLIMLGLGGTLAWLVNSAYGFDWRDRTLRPHFSDYYEGAAAQAKRYGFQLEVFDFNAPRLTPARLASILAARGVQGVLLCPQPRPDTNLEFPWQNFSAVTFGYTPRPVREFGPDAVIDHYREFMPALARVLAPR